MKSLNVPTQVKVKTGYWNLIHVERRLVMGGFGVKYVPHYRHTRWTHPPTTSAEQK